MVTQAVLKSCDTLKEGFLTDPRACTFDFKKLSCSPGAASETCLTAQPATIKIRTNTGAVIGPITKPGAPSKIIAMVISKALRQVMLPATIADLSIRLFLPD